MQELSLVTGASGLLGNNLVRVLLSHGEKVRCGVRNLTFLEPFADLDCEVVYADILDKESLLSAMRGVDTLYHAAAIFKHWSENPQKEIIQANLDGTQNILEAAAECGIKKVVYVSSMAALDRSKVPMDETGWGEDFPNPYYRAKNDSEKLAWELAAQLGLWMVTVLPSGIIGPYTYGHLSATNSLLNMIVKNRLPFNPNYSFNFVHAQDVARGMILAAQKGKSGERYILATEPSISTTRVMEIAETLFPGTKNPPILPKALQLILATMSAGISSVTHNPPALIAGNIRHFYMADETMNISKARNALGYEPMPPEKAIRETLLHLATQNF